MRQLLSKLYRDDSAQGMVEYLLVVGIIAFAAIAAMQTFANSISNAFLVLSTKLGQYIS